MGRWVDGATPQPSPWPSPYILISIASFPFLSPDYRGFFFFEVLLFLCIFRTLRPFMSSNSIYLNIILCNPSWKQLQNYPIASVCDIKLPSLLWPWCLRWWRWLPIFLPFGIWIYGSDRSNSAWSVLPTILPLLLLHLSFCIIHLILFYFIPIILLHSIQPIALLMACVASPLFHSH